MLRYLINYLFALQSGCSLLHQTGTVGLDRFSIYFTKFNLLLSQNSGKHKIVYHKIHLDFCPGTKRQ
jgi:hypothetical protein